LAKARQLGLTFRELQHNEAQSVRLPDGTLHPVTYAVKPTTLTLASSTGMWRGLCSGAASLIVLPGLTAYDLILGTPFFHHFGGGVLCGSHLGPNPIVELGIPGQPGNVVRLTTNTRPASVPTLASLKAWRRFCEQPETELFLCMILPGGTPLWDNEDDINDDVASTQPTAQDANNAELDELRHEIEQRWCEKVLVDDLPPGLPPSRGPKADHSHSLDGGRQNKTPSLPTAKTYEPFTQRYC
jgi:hypothetical protein